MVGIWYDEFRIQDTEYRSQKGQFQRKTGIAGFENVSHWRGLFRIQETEYSSQKKEGKKWMTKPEGSLKNRCCLVELTGVAVDGRDLIVQLANHCFEATRVHQ